MNIKTKKKEKKMINKVKSILKSLLVLSLIFGISPMRLTAFEATESKTLVLLNEENLKLNVTLEENNKELIWKFNISKNEETDTRLGLIAFVNDEVIEFEKHAHWQLADDYWFYGISSKISQDVIVLKTSIEVDSIKLKFTSIDDSDMLAENLEVNIDAEPSHQEEDVVEIDSENNNVIDDSMPTESDQLIDSNLLEDTKIFEFQINKNDLLVPTSAADDNIVNKDDIDLEVNNGNQIEDIDKDLTVDGKADQSVDDESILFVDSLDKLELIKDQILNNVEPTLNEYKDPFDYMEDEKGRYPKTDLVTDPGYSGSKTTMNFNYGLKSGVSGIEPKTKHAYGVDLNFTSGYHNHPYGKGEGVLTKKTVKPTKDPNKFELEVDIIGGATPLKNPIDVMLVIDKSASMNFLPNGNETSNISRTRWSLLKNAIDKLAGDLLISGNDVQMGMTSFGSTWTSQKTTEVFSEVANFGTKTDKKYLTDNLQIFRNNNVLKVNTDGKVPTGSGTPTFIGIETAFRYLKQSSREKDLPNVKTYIIVLTDGVSTFGPNSNYVGLVDSDEKFVDRFSNTNHNLKLSLPANDNANIQRYTGDGTESQNDTKMNSITNTTISRFEKLLTEFNNDGTKVKPSVIGLGFGKQKTDTTPDKLMKKLLRAISDEGKYYDATDADELNKAFEIIKRLITSDQPSFNLGQLIDPMSEFVNYIDESLSSEALSLNYGGTVGSYINLSTKDVRYIDGTVNENAPLYAKDIEVAFEKDVNNKTTGIHLKEMNLGTDGVNRMGYRIKYTVELKEEYRDGKFYPANGPTRAIAFNYDDAIGMAVPSVRVPITDFEFLKVGQDNKPLQAAEFELYKKVVGSADTWNSLGTKVSPESGLLNFGNLTHGRYRLVETESPDGYQTIDPIEFDIVQGMPVENGNLTIKGLESLTNSQGKIVIKNLLEDFILQVEKMDNYGNAVQEVKFRLEGNGIIPIELSGTGPLLNEFKFSGLRPGTYILSEIKNPDKYVTMDPVTIVINDDGTVSIDGSLDDENLVVEANIIKFKAINILKGILPSTGGSDMMMFKLVPVMLLILSGSVGLFGIIRQRRYQTYED